MTPTHWLLLRGLCRQRRHWFNFPQRFGERLKVEVVTLDLPGAGLERGRASPSTMAAIAEDVEQRLKTCSSNTPSWGILGLSLGGMVGVQLCTQHPELFSHLVLVNASSRLSPVHWRMQPAALAQLSYAGTRPNPLSREEIIYRLTTALQPRGGAGCAAAAASIEREEPISRRLLLRQLRAAAAFAPPPRLAQPCLVVSSRHDAVVSSRCSARIAGHFGAEHVEHPSAGHDLPLDDADWLSARVRGWLETTAASRAY